MQNNMPAFTAVILLMTMFLYPEFSSSIRSFINRQREKIKEHNAAKNEDRLKKYYEIDLRNFK